MFTVRSTLTIGMNYGEPAGEALKGTAIPEYIFMANVKDAMAHYGIDCYTVIDCKGYWQGAAENSKRIEVIHGGELHKTLVSAARWLKLALMQEAILVTKEDLLADLV